VEIDLPDTSAARDLLSLVRAKIIDAMSFGFQVVEKREITKYRGKHPEPVYLTTVIKHLTVPDRPLASR
jgi:phage head maturation protease